MMTKTKTTRPKQIKVKAASKSEDTRRPSGAIEQEIARLKKLRASTLEESERVNSQLLPKETFNSLRIAAATGDSEAKRRIAENDSTTRRLAESHSLLEAIDEQLLVLEKELELAVRNQWREEREELALQQGESAKKVEALCKEKLAPLMQEWAERDLEISKRTRKLGESVGLSPQRKLYETLCQYFWPILGKHLQRPSLSGDLVSWSSRFAPSDSQAKDETKLR